MFADVEALEARALLSATSLDPSFGDGGKVFTPFHTASTNSRINAMVRQPDGKLVVAGTASSPSTTGGSFLVLALVLARYNSNGSLDTSFGEGGIAQTTFASASDIALLGNGRIVVEGDKGLAEFNPDGSLHTAFGHGGLVTRPLGANSYAFSIVVDSTGGIIVGGSDVDTHGHSRFLLARLNAATGASDASFGIDGRVLTDFPSGGSGVGALTLLPNGNIVAAGGYRNGFALAEYTSGGSLVPGFGSQGQVTIDFGQGNYAGVKAVVADGSGRVVGGGDMGHDYALARCNPDGSLDTTFGNAGKIYNPTSSDNSDPFVHYNSYSFLCDLGIDGIGRVIIAVNYETNVEELDPFREYSFLSSSIYRLKSADGSYDNSFNPGSKFDVVDAMSIDDAGNVIVSGAHASDPGDGNSLVRISDFELAAYTASGATDKDFGRAGAVVTPIKAKESFAAGSAVAVQDDGRLLVAGTALVGHDWLPALARYKAHGTLDSTFGSGGLVTLPNSEDSPGIANALVLDGKGHVLVVGQHSFARVNLRDGTIDKSFGDALNKVTTYDSEWPPVVTVDQEGRTLVAGRSSDFSYYVARYTLGGALDVSFGDHGKVIGPLVSQIDFRALAVDDRGRVLAASNDQIVRLTASGAVDATFGSRGLAGFDLGGFRANALFFDGDGRINLAGTNGSGLALVRFTSGGDLDKTFGTDGEVFSYVAGLKEVTGFALDRTGHLLVVGTASGGKGKVVLARYNIRDGSPDTAFGSGGKVITDLGWATDTTAALAVQADGRFVLAGTSAGQFALARFQGDHGSPPVNSVPMAQSLPRNGKLTFTGSRGIVIFDPEAGGGSPSVTLTATHGTLRLRPTAGLRHVTGNGTNVLKISGRLAALNDALTGLSFRADPGFRGMAHVRIRTSDRSHTGGRGLLTDTDAVSITVGQQAPVPSPAFIRATSYTAKAGKSLTVTSPRGLGRAFTDPDGDEVIIKLVARPTQGKLTLKRDGSFTYRPPAGLKGKVTFRVEPSDGRHTGPTATVTITVT
jgi:uncharacterized delta-60 repeat protein